MKLHLINGFLGSGKTTAIITATKNLIQKGKKVGIVTNDKGRFQVDTAFFQLSHIPTKQVTGGCFRCSFSEFEEKIMQLQNDSAPDIIFAELVGSCVDLVNTIFLPVQQNIQLSVDKTTYSVFTDIRLFQLWIEQEPLPFSNHVNYLFTKQIEESKILVLNKSDLLSKSEQDHILITAIEKFPEKLILLQNSLEQPSLTPWLSALEHISSESRRAGFAVDYPTYKSGEKEMAWLDHKFHFIAAPENIKPTLIEMIQFLLKALQENDAFIGHIKLLLAYPESGTKVSFTTADFLDKSFPLHWKEEIPDIKVNSLDVMLNARVSMGASEFSEIVKNAAEQAALSMKVKIRSEEGSSYNPEMSMNRP